MRYQYKIVIVLFSLAMSVYIFSHRGEGAHFNYFVLMADSFLHGRLNMINPPPWLNEMVSWEGLYYSVFPPMPAFLVTPFVAIFGVGFYQPFLSWLLGSANVVLAYLVFSKLFRQKISFWMSILYGFGTIQWYHTEVGSAWYVAHISAMFFLWLMLLEVFTRQRLFLIGLFIGAAYLSRIPTILSIMFVFIFLQAKLFNFTGKRLKIFPKSITRLTLGVLPAIIINFFFNYLRYGVIYDKGYALLPVFNEPWYEYGLINIRYIPIHLKEVLFEMPYFIPQFPFIIPNLFAMAIWLITPAYFLIMFANFKKRIYLAVLIAIIAIFIPDLMHGGNGFSQFGYRHTLDFLPFLLILVGSGLESKFNIWSKLLIICSILINLWGVIMISFLKIWAM